MRKIILFFITAVIGFTMPSFAKADIVSCNNCTQSQMKASAESAVSRRIAGRHNVKVINIENADYHYYQIDVVNLSGGIRRNPNDEIQLYTVKLTVHNEPQIKNQLQRLNSTIKNIKDIAAGKVLLPDTSPYRSATEALTYADDFASYLSDFLNKEHSGIQSAVFDFAATAETLAANLQVGLSSIVSVSTSLSSGVVSMVVFPDGSEVEFQFTFVNNLTSGLQLSIILPKSPKAYDAEGKRIPKNQIEARFYNTTDKAINLNALVDYFRFLNIDTQSNNQGGSSLCEMESLRCDNTGSKCIANYKCP